MLTTPMWISSWDITSTEVLNLISTTPVSRPMHFMYTRVGAMHNKGLPYWSPNHYCYMVPQTSVKVYRPRPGKAEQWKKVLGELDKVKDCLQDTPHDVIGISDWMRV